MIDAQALHPRPVGVKILRSVDELRDIPVYHGVSYCDAVRRAGLGQPSRVLPGSITVCEWAPAVLGLKAPENDFERHLSPKLPYPVNGLLLAAVHEFPGAPEVVIARNTRRTLAALIQRAGATWADTRSPLLWQGHRGRMELSVIPLLTARQPGGHYRLVQRINELLALLARSPRWRAFTHRLFRSHIATAVYDAFISRALADMSVCRNSTVIPLLTHQVNVSFFCSGGITWGRNNPDHLTSGWPWPDYSLLLEHSQTAAAPLTAGSVPSTTGTPGAGSSGRV